MMSTGKQNQAWFRNDDELKHFADVASSRLRNMCRQVSQAEKRHRKPSWLKKLPWNQDSVRSSPPDNKRRRIFGKGGEPAKIETAEQGGGDTATIETAKPSSEGHGKTFKYEWNSEIMLATRTCCKTQRVDVSIPIAMDSTTKPEDKVIATQLKFQGF